MTSVSAILLNWNSGPYGAIAAESVRAQRGDCELIVVDNASEDDSLRSIEAAASPSLVIRHKTNLGFGAGMNSGIAAVSSEFVLPLNCDVQLGPDFVATAIDTLGQHRECAVVGGAVKWVDTLPTKFPLDPGPPDEGPRSLSMTMRTVEHRTPVAGPCTKVSGSCPVMRVEALDQVVQRFEAGPYDPVFDTYGEDIDLAIKLARLGWQVRYEPTMSAAHLRSFSSARRAADKRGRLRANIVRGRWISIARHSRRRQLPVSLGLAGAEDIVFGLVQSGRGDLSVWRDLTSAWRFAWSKRDDLVDFRRRHAGSLAGAPELSAPRLPGVGRG